jgi:thymidylate kinase
MRRAIVMQSNGIKVVSFSGIDGAGKSTQIDALGGYVRSLGLPVTVLTFWDNIVAFPRFRERLSSKAFKGDQGVGSPDQPISRRDKNVTAWYITAIRICLYTLDSFSLGIAVSRFMDSGDGVVIFDRYIYDELANLPLQRWFIRWFIRLLLVFVPKPDVKILLDAEPETAVARKPEYPLEFVRCNRDGYLQLARLVGGMTIIPPLPIDQATDMVEEVVSSKCLRREMNSFDFGLPFPPTAAGAKTTTNP